MKTAFEVHGQSRIQRLQPLTAWAAINLDVDRSNLVCDLKNKALKDCHNPSRAPYEEREQTKSWRHQLTDRKDGKDRQMACIIYFRYLHLQRKPEGKTVNYFKYFGLESLYTISKIMPHQQSLLHTQFT